MDWKVRFIDYPKQFHQIEADVMRTIREVLERGDLMMRQQLLDFEEHLAAYCGASHAVGVNNCTDGLHLALHAAGIGPGDEVISVSHTFVATIASIHHVGATPVLVDIADDHNIDVSLIEPAITPHTKAILPVSLNGRCADLPAILAIAETHGLKVIEDSAQALGASIDGRRAGSFGLAAAFSFYPAKLLGAYGDSGAVTTSDDAIAEKLRLLRNHGRTADGQIAFWSFNSRMDNLHAAILDLKLARLDEALERRREIAARYHEGLSDLTQVLLPPPPTEGGRHHDVFQNFEIEAEDRDALHAHLKQEGIENMLPWGGRGVHQFPALGLTHFHLPRTEELFRKALLLPMYPELEDHHVDEVVRTVRGFYRVSSPGADLAGVSQLHHGD